MPLSATERTRHRRMRENGRTSLESLFEVLRAGFVCHLGVVVDGAPMVVPTVYGFDSSRLYFHGSVASRSLGAEGVAPDVCVTVTHVDGLARPCRRTFRSPHTSPGWSIDPHVPT